MAWLVFQTCHRSWKALMIRPRIVTFGVIWSLLLMPVAAFAADWPQFMRDSRHTGDAAGDRLKMPLKLVAQARLDDAILSAPAVVAGRAYVVDQMGTAYCVDPATSRVLWKTAPEEGDSKQSHDAFGSNTSSPCVARGRIYYGTTTGRLIILKAKSGAVVKSIAVGSPIVGPVTAANESIFFQTRWFIVSILMAPNAGAGTIAAAPAPRRHTAVRAWR